MGQNYNDEAFVGGGRSRPKERPCRVCHDQSPACPNCGGEGYHQKDEAFVGFRSRSDMKGLPPPPDDNRHMS